MKGERTQRGASLERGGETAKKKKEKKKKRHIKKRGIKTSNDNGRGAGGGLK